MAEMIRAACDYRWVGIYKIVRSDFVIVAKTGKCRRAYPRFPITRDWLPRRWNRSRQLWWRTVHKIPLSADLGSRRSRSWFR